MRLGVASGAFPDLEPYELIDHAAAIGYTGIEWRVAELTDVSRSRPAHFKHNNFATLPPDEDELLRAAERCRQYGLSVIGISPYISRGDVVRARRIIELASAIGAPTVRLWAPVVDDSPLEARKAFIEFLAAIGPYSRDHRVRLGLEVHHGTIAPSLTLATAIVRDADVSGLGIILDIGNFAVEGFEDLRITLPPAASLITHVQIKNASLAPSDGLNTTWNWSPLDAGILPLRTLVLQAAMYLGDRFLVCEDFSREQSDVRRMQFDKEVIEHYLEGN